MAESWEVRGVLESLGKDGGEILAFGKENLLVGESLVDCEFRTERDNLNIQTKSDTSMFFSAISIKY